MKIVFTNVCIAYGGCDCCGDETTFHTEPGPYVIETPNHDVPVSTHAEIAFGTGVVDYDYTIVSE